MAGVYSERFLIATVGGQIATYIVPPGKRAVIRNVVCTNRDSAAQVYTVFLAGFHVVNFSVPALTGTDSRDLRQVAYAGESIGLRVATSFQTAMISGYEFADTAGRAAAEGMVLELDDEDALARLP